jgi:hypothetical protein
MTRMRTGGGPDDAGDYLRESATRSRKAMNGGF